MDYSYRIKNLQSGQNGNVLFFLFIAIALFAALSFSVGNMLRGAPDSISKEQANLYANEIVDYARSVREGIQMMRISNGCAADAISFVTTDLTDAGYTYTNANAPGDNSCDIFDIAGGGIHYLAPKSEYYESGTGTGGFTEDWAFTGNSCIRNVGGEDVCSADEAELIMFLTGIKQQVCRRINEKLGVIDNSEDIPDQNISIQTANTFQGAYSGTNNANFTIGWTDPGPLVGQAAGCVNDTVGNPGGYVFYYSVLDR